MEAIVIDDHVLEKIERRHGVHLYEVEQVCFSAGPHIRRGRAGLYQVFGASEAGRYVFVVLASRGTGVWQVATARDMTDRERSLYRQHGGR